jgi:type VI secretion system protein ImpM
MNNSAQEATAGLYGKLPESRDFLRRGLPNRFVVPWDNWLARVLATSQGTIGESWLEGYLTSPPWRFVLDPDLLGQAAWLGVVVSSVDALHRCFPLTLAAPSSKRFAEIVSLFDCEAWMARVETVALAMIDGSGDVEESLTEFKLLADELQDLSGSPRTARLEAARSSYAVWSQAFDLVDAKTDQERSQTNMAAFSYWWHGAWPGHPAIALRCRGLPQATACASLFDAKWFERGLLEALRTAPE